MDRRQEYHQHLISLLLSGEIGDKDELAAAEGQDERRVRTARGPAQL